MKYIAQQSDLIKRVYWLIRLRWVAVGGVTLTVFLSNRFFFLSLPVLPIYGVVAFLAAYNFFFLIYLNQLQVKASIDLSPRANRLANIQISLDLLSLFVLIHFSSGIENPFISYFIFHMIIASILLSRRAAFLQATLAIFLFAALAILEYLGILAHYPLAGFIKDAYNNRLYVAGVFFVFASTLYIAVYMATTISVALKDREASLRAANRLLTQKDQAKSKYVLRVTHDIKEHLAAVQGCVEPVVSGITGPLNTQQNDLLRRAVRRTGKLLFFVKALLDISRIKLSRDIKMESFSLKETIDNAAGYIESRAKDKDVEFKVNIQTGLEKISGIQAYLEETIANLLANAIKYTPSRGIVKLNVIDKRDSILIKIEDTGIGIPADELSKVFDEFYRARNAKQIERNGTGLGLSIAKQVINKHQGKIWVESEEGKGSTFYISLPKKQGLDVK